MLSSWEHSFQQAFLGVALRIEALTQESAVGIFTFPPRVFSTELSISALSKVISGSVQKASGRFSTCILFNISAALVILVPWLPSWDNFFSWRLWVFLVSRWTDLLSFFCSHHLLCSAVVLDLPVSLYTFSLDELIQPHSFGTSYMLMNSKSSFLASVFLLLEVIYSYGQLHTFYFYMSDFRNFKPRVKSLPWHHPPKL